MKALLLKETLSKVIYTDVSIASPPEGWSQIELMYSALNHRDVWITRGLYPGIKTPCILGSDGCGLMDGKRVLLNPGVGWGIREEYPSIVYTILGMPTHGTFAQRVNVPDDNIFFAPRHLSDEEVAALPLCGLTAYRALISKCKTTENDKVLISGIGGGVALVAFQFAIALGCQVYVTSGSDDKIETAISMGAKGGVNYTISDWGKELKRISGGVDVLIDGAAGEGFPHLIECCRAGARIAIYGGTAGRINNLKPQILFWKQLTIHGTSMGSDNEFSDMLSFVESHSIHPVVDEVIPLSEGWKGFEKMESGKQFGKIVFDNNA